MASRLWNRRGQAGVDDNNAATPRNLQDLAALPDGQQETVVASFWSHATGEEPKKETKEAPGRRENFVRMGSAFFQGRSRSPSPSPEGRQNSSDGAASNRGTRWGRRPAAADEQAIIVTDLKEENECLKQQVKILQAALQEKDVAQTEESLLSLEDDLVLSKSSSSDTAVEVPASPSPRRRRWSQDAQKELVVDITAAAEMTSPVVETEQTSETEQNPGEVQRAIQMSMELAESRAQVDTLQNKLQHAEHTIRLLKEQLAESATLAKAASSGNHSPSRGSFSGWLGRNEVVSPSKENNSTHSGASTITADSTSASPEDTLHDTETSTAP